MPLALLFVIHCLAVYRAARFVISDELVDGWRDRIKRVLSSPDGPGLEPGERFRDNPSEFIKDKLWSLIQCPYCTSGWIAGGVVLVHLLWLDGLPLPFWWWGGIWGGSLIAWKIVED